MEEASAEVRVLLDEKNWFPHNRAVLEDHLGRWSKRAASGERLVATFDFDNTSIFHDVGEAAMRYQLEQLALGFDEDLLSALLPEEAAGERTFASGLPLGDVREDLLEDWRALAKVRDERGLEAARAHPSRRDFAARMAWFYAALEHDPKMGAGVAYPFLARWMAGFKKDEVRSLAKEAVRFAGAERPGRTSWTCSAERRSGALTARFKTGLYAHEEMKDLMRALTSAGVQVFIVTASQQQLVEGAVEALGYPVPREHVFGMRLVEEGGRLGARSLAERDYPLTWRAGKRAVIESFLPARPVLAAGDSDTDLEMLTSFAETELRLIIRRDVVGHIRSLYDDDKTLLQGRDEREGCFIRARESVLLPDDAPVVHDDGGAGS